MLLTVKEAWQIELTRAISSLDVLLQKLELQKTALAINADSYKNFPLRVPHPYLSRIKPNDPTDPLLLQVLPTNHENLATLNFVPDPLLEKNYIKTPGLLHKYHGRVLLTLTGACAINCRYCFRRHFPYQENSLSKKKQADIIDYISRDSSIFEVILSGGDPLILKDDQLEELIKALETIPHLKYLRFHTRLPIMIPTRITDKLCKILSLSRFTTSIVIHCNHRNEIDAAVTHALHKLKNSNITLLNQSVVLRGINDNAETLIALSHTLYRAGVMPYYLHLLDPVAGAAHFDVAEANVKILMQSLQNSLPGYLVPKLVREEPGKRHKTMINCNDPDLATLAAVKAQ